MSKFRHYFITPEGGLLTPSGLPASKSAETRYYKWLGENWSEVVSVDKVGRTRWKSGDWLGRGGEYVHIRAHLEIQNVSPAYRRSVGKRKPTTFDTELRKDLKKALQQIASLIAATNRYHKLTGPAFLVASPYRARDWSDLSAVQRYNIRTILFNGNRNFFVGGFIKSMETRSFGMMILNNLDQIQAGNGSNVALPFYWKIK